MNLYSSNPTLPHVTIENNTAEDYYGGGMIVYRSNPTLSHVTISGNTTIGWGGGGVYFMSSDATLNNVTITNNTADYGGGMYISSGEDWFSNPILTNSIIWDNSPESIYFLEENNPSTISIQYSDIEGGEEGIITNDNGEVYWLEGNIDTDPLFTDPENGDYTLQEGSPCIDAGTADLDGDGEDDIEYVGAAPDMGAFEYGALPAVTGFMFYTFDTYISLTWDPANQDGFQYYLLERSTDEEFAEDVVSNELVSNYYEDDSLEYDTEYFYRVSYYAGVQQSYYSEVLSVTLQWLDVDGEKLPTVYAIHQNYPNPFNPTTQIKYDLPEDAMVSITIYDIMGRSIKSLVNSNQSAGYRSIQWNATNNLGEPVSAGLYLYTIEAGKFRQTKKMVLLK